MILERVDLVVFGATGFTGKIAVKEVEKFAKVKNFTWGVAGRRKEALESVLKEFAPESENVKIIIADVNDEESLRCMTEQAKVLINCCGPYRIYGEPVIRACVTTRTHHIDISEEPFYMENVQIKFNKVAQDAGIYIISACGAVDSILSDLGVVFIQNKFEGEVNSIETYLRFWLTGNVEGAIVHSGTWKSAVYEYAHSIDLEELREVLYKKEMPDFSPKLKRKSILHRNFPSEGWCTIFPGPDLSVCSRTQRFLFEKYNQRPVQVQSYLTLGSIYNVIKTAFWGGFFSMLKKCQCGRNLLVKNPRLFSGGLFSHEGPSTETMKNTNFSVTFIAKGWPDMLTDPADERKEPPNKEMITKVSCVDPIYGTTCLTLVLSAIMILKESDKMPDTGGVLPPGAAFGKTSLMEELSKRGIKFDIISST